MNRWQSLGFGMVAAMSLAPFSVAQSDIPQPTDVILEADDIINDEANNSVIAEGNVVVEYGDRVMRADRLVYNLTTRRILATGNVQIFDPDGTQRFADEIDVDEELGDGYAINFSTRLPDGGVAIARSAVRQSGGVNSLEKVVYTACPVCEEKGATPTWALRARRAELNQETQMISYRDAVLEVAGIPVFYLPYFTHPDPTSERRSGLLVPNFGTSSKLGAFYQQPYYWALSKSSDITISPAVYGNVNPLLAIDYRKRFYSGQIRLEASGTNEKEFDSDGQKFGEAEWRSHIYGEGRFAISQNWEWGFGIEYATDDLYTRRYSIPNQSSQRGIYNSQPRRHLSQLYAVGQDDNYYADIAVLKTQGLRSDDLDSELPLVAPVFFAERTFDFGGLGHLAVNASAAGLTREVGFDSQRVSLGMDWRDQNLLPGGFVFEPFLEARADYYALNEDLSGQSDASRVVGSVGGELSLPLVRTSPSVNILLEPTAMVAWGGSSPNDAAIPNEDSPLFELDDASLYDPSATPGYDLYEGGARAAFGLAATASWQSGLQARAMAGRRWRENDDASFNTFSGLKQGGSDWITSAGISYRNDYSIDARVRLDEGDFEPTRIDVRGAMNMWRVNAAVRYFRLDESITTTGRGEEGVDISGEFTITKNFSLIYSQIRDIAGTPVALRDPITDQLLRDPISNAILFDDRPRDLRRSIGVAWQDECSRFEIAFTRSEAIDRSIGPNDTLEFRFFLKTLGGVGDNSFD